MQIQKSQETSRRNNLYFLKVLQRYEIFNWNAKRMCNLILIERNFIYIFVGCAEVKLKLTVKNASNERWAGDEGNIQHFAQFHTKITWA